MDDFSAETLRVIRTPMTEGLFKEVVIDGGAVTGQVLPLHEND